MTNLERGVIMILIILLTALAVMAGYTARGIEDRMEMQKDNIVVIHKCKH